MAVPWLAPLIRAITALASLLVQAIQAHQRKTQDAARQASADRIDADPAGAFRDRFGVRDTSPGQSDATATDPGEHHRDQ